LGSAVDDVLHLHLVPAGVGNGCSVSDTGRGEPRARRRQTSAQVAEVKVSSTVTSAAITIRSRW
jgi:hypothetical protein